MIVAAGGLAPAEGAAPTDSRSAWCISDPFAAESSFTTGTYAVGLVRLLLAEYTMRNSPSRRRGFHTDKSCLEPVPLSE